MDEFQLIKRYFSAPDYSAASDDSKASRDIEDKNSGVDVSIGDDCAVLNITEGKQLVVSIDTLVEGAHFFASSNATDIAERAVAASVSDLAAMGARPKWLTLALTLPEYNQDWLKAFSQGLHRAVKHYGMRLIGGDTTRGPLTITVQVHGELDSGKAIKRSGAKVDDNIYVTGPLGDGAAALAMMKSELNVNNDGQQYLNDRFYRPQAQIQAGLALSNLANAAIDISDGLIADLTHVCRASGVGAIVDEKQIPMSDVLMRSASAAQRQLWALSGGDDYHLCFTVSPAREEQLKSVFAHTGLICHNIGKIISGDSVISAHTKKIFDFHGGGYGGGYSHF